MRVSMFEHIHCPFCGSVNISGDKESFNYKAAFWGTLFLSIWGLLFGFFCRKRTVGHCDDCGGDFLIYNE